MPKKVTRANLTKKLRAKAIPIPSDATLDELQHRLDHWLPGPGYTFRLIRYPRSKQREQIVANLIKKQTYWVPNSHYAQNLLNSGIVFVMSRSEKPPTDAKVLNVPNSNDEEE